jgi:hypothetical protein
MSLASVVQVGGNTFGIAVRDARRLGGRCTAERATPA